MLERLSVPQAQRRTQMSAAAFSIVANAEAPWPPRPDPSVLSRSIPLFFISPDSDGFWIACEADFRIGGIFLLQRSALHFAQRHSAPQRCATMILEEPHTLATENKGNPFVDLLRPALRQLRHLASKLRSFAARSSRAHIEERLLRVALEADLYRDRYKHSNKNDDDLPMVTEIPVRRQADDRRSVATGIKGALPTLIAFMIFALILTAIVALKAVIWLPRLPQ